MKRNDAGVACTRSVRPGDALVGGLLCNDCVPLFCRSSDLRFPTQMGVIELSHFFNPTHKLWKLLELRPLIVRNVDWHIDVNRFFDIRGRTRIFIRSGHTLSERAFPRTFARLNRRSEVLFLLLHFLAYAVELAAEMLLSLGQHFTFFLFYMMLHALH